MYDYLLSATESFIRYGLSPTALIVAVIALFKTKKAKRLIARRIPWLFRDESDVLQYQDRQKRIEAKVDALLAERGIQWQSNSPPPISKQAKTQHIRNYYSYSRKVIQLVNQLRRVKKMTKWIRPDKLVIIFGLLTTSANEFLGTNIESGNIVAFFVILFTYLKANEIINITRYAHGLPVEFRVNSSKLVFTLIGLGMTLYATYSGEALSQETIYSIAGLISGYNVYEGKKDAQEAIREGGKDNAELDIPIEPRL